MLQDAARPVGAIAIRPWLAFFYEAVANEKAFQWAVDHALNAVVYRDITAEGLLRAASYKGLRPRG